MVHKDYNGVSYPSDKLFLNPLVNLALPFLDILGKVYWN
jgi:hypothetical protein